jgi:Secretion system C-terminal sorting domain
MKNFIYSFLIIALLFGSMDAYSRKSKNKLPRYLDINYTEKVEAGQNLYPGRELPPIDKTITPGPAKILNGNGITINKVSNKTGRNQSETWITIDRNNPDKICASANDMGYWGGYWSMAAYYTTDGGTTWGESATPSISEILDKPSGAGYAIFDPAMAYDADGNLFYCYNSAVSYYGEGESHGSGGVFVNKSSDGGKTWQETFPVAMEETSGKNGDFHDKVLFAADYHDDSPYKNRLYATWLFFPNDNTKQSGVAYSYSDDGEDWTNYKFVTGASGSGYGRQSPNPVIGPNGELYVVFRGTKYNSTTTDALIQKSTNGGESWAFASPKVAQTVYTCGGSNGVRPALLDKQEMRVSSFPCIGVDQRNGNVYIVQTGKDDKDNYGVYFTKSTNGAADWSKSKRVDNNALRNDMFFPAIDVDPVTGLITILYYSSQNDPENHGVDAYLAISADEGANWNHVRITPQTWYLDNAQSVFNSGGEAGNYYWGDYNSIVAHGGSIHACFWMPSNLETANFYSVNTYVASIKDIPNPTENLQYQNDYQKPTEVLLTWNDPTSTLFGTPLGDFKVIVYRGSEEIDQVDKGKQTYTDNGAIDGVEFTYTVKVRVASGIESDPESVNGIAGGSPYPMPAALDNAVPASDGFTIDVDMPNTHVDGSVFHDFDRLDIYFDGVVYTSITEGLEYGQINNIKIDATAEKFQMVTAVIFGKRGEKATPSENSNEVLAYAGTPLNELSEDFESEDMTPIYSKALVQDTGWVRTDLAAAGGSYSISDSPGEDYSKNEKNAIYFAPVVITQSKTTLSFDHIALIHKNNGDYGVIEVSTDFGKTFKAFKWLDIIRSEGFKAGDLAGSSWFSEHLDFSEFAGETVILRFRLVSDNVFEDDGWYIDNLSIDDMPVSVEEQTNFSNLLKLSIRPNPVKTNAQLIIKSPVNSSAQIKVYDAIGNEVMTINKSQINDGLNQVDFDTDKLTNGFYYVRVSLDGFSKTTPMIIKR